MIHTTYLEDRTLSLKFVVYEYAFTACYKDSFTYFTMSHGLQKYQVLTEETA
jgi:hypothetical protein